MRYIEGVDLLKHCLVKPGHKVKLENYDPADKLGLKKDEKALQKNIKRLWELQHLLYADSTHALLIVLQSMDAGGKDGTISHVMSGVNPQGCQVTSFKQPTPEELAHDYLWRIHKAVPRCGDIGIFNRSHYEDVLVVRVHKLVPKSVWSERYSQINEFEDMLTRNNITILKFFLNVGKDEQKKRLNERLTNPTKNWKFSAHDLEERSHWDEYQKAYEVVLAKCSTDAAPWHIIPANDNWIRNFAISQIIVHTLEKMDLKFPAPAIDLSKAEIK